MLFLKVFDTTLFTKEKVDPLCSQYLVHTLHIVLRVLLRYKNFQSHDPIFKRKIYLLTLLTNRKSPFLNPRGKVMRPENHIIPQKLDHCLSSTKYISFIRKKGSSLVDVSLELSVYTNYID